MFFLISIGSPSGPAVLPAFIESIASDILSAVSLALGPQRYEEIQDY